MKFKICLLVSLAFILFLLFKISQSGNSGINGVWRAAYWVQKDRKISGLRIPYKSALFIDSRGAYDSEGFFGFGTYTLEDKSLDLTMQSSFFPSAPQFMQNTLGGWDNFKQSIKFQLNGNYLDFPVEGSDRRLRFIRSDEPLYFSAKKIFKP